MGNAVSEADSYTEEYSAYESSRLRADDNDTWDYSMEDSRGRMAPSESSTAPSEVNERGKHRKSRSPAKSRSRTPPRSPQRSPRNNMLLQSFSEEEAATMTTDMAHREQKAKQRRSSSPRRPSSPRSTPRNHRERRQPQYDSDDSSEEDERDRRRLYRYGRDDSYENVAHFGRGDESDEESDDEKYRKTKSPRHDRRLHSKDTDEREEDEEEQEEDESDDMDYVSIKDVSVELNPNRRLQNLREQLSADKTETTREVDVIQLHDVLDDDAVYTQGQRSRGTSPNMASYGQPSSTYPQSPIHLEHMPSPPTSPQRQPSVEKTLQMIRPSSPGQTARGISQEASRSASPRLFFRNEEIVKNQNEQRANSNPGNQWPSQVYTAVPLEQPGAVPAMLLNEYNGALSPIPSVTAETYYGGSFHAIIDQAELYPELNASYAEMSRQEAPYHGAVDDDDDNDSRDPNGVHACDETVEHSLMTSPEEMMARNIIQARLRRALAQGLSFNESTEESASVPSVSLKSRGTFDNNGDSTGSFDDGDIEFVHQYETVFDQFVNANLNLMARHPELIYNLRVAKLQKLFQIAADTETEIDEQIQLVEAQKRQILIKHKKELIEAARHKAALEIQLRQELHSIEQATLDVTGKMTWQLIIANLTRANRHNQLIQNLSHTRVSRRTILEILPATEETRGIRVALSTPAGRRLTDKQQQEMRQLQVDTTFQKAEVNVLEKKLAALQTNAKKYAWVDSIFIRMNPRHVKKLKHRFQKNLGVSF